MPKPGTPFDSRGTALLHQKYWWDDNGNLVSRKDEVASETERFSYDNLDRLVGVSGPDQFQGQGQADATERVPPKGT